MKDISLMTEREGIEVLSRALGLAENFKKWPLHAELLKFVHDAGARVHRIAPGNYAIVQGDFPAPAPEVTPPAPEETAEVPTQEELTEELGEDPKEPRGDLSDTTMGLLGVLVVALVWAYLITHPSSVP